MNVGVGTGLAGEEAAHPGGKAGSHKHHEPLPAPEDLEELKPPELPSQTRDWKQRWDTNGSQHNGSDFQSHQGKLPTK